MRADVDRRRDVIGTENNEIELDIPFTNPTSVHIHICIYTTSLNNIY